MITSTNPRHSFTGTRGIGVRLHIVHSGRQKLELLAMADAIKIAVEHFGLETVQGMTIEEIMEHYVTP